jgi:hypothetical protein
MRVRIDFVVPARLKRALIVAVPIGVVALGSVAYAGVPGVFKDGDFLSAQSMNDNFAAVDTRLTQLEALSKASSNGTYCGSTAATKGDLSALSARGSGYAKAGAECQKTCTSSAAHMCTASEVARLLSLGSQVPKDSWYATGAAVDVWRDCEGFTSTKSISCSDCGVNGNVLNGSNIPVAGYCYDAKPVLCCN